MGNTPNEPTDILIDDHGVPLAVSLDSPRAEDASLVGEGAALLATGKRLGLPVADGLVVTGAGLSCEDMHALKHAWVHTGGPVRIIMSDRRPGGGLGAGPSAYHAETWLSMLDAMSKVLSYDGLENPTRGLWGWGVVVLKFPELGRPAILSRPPDGAVEVWTNDLAPLPTRSLRRRLCTLAEDVARLLGRPVSLEVLSGPEGELSIVDLRPYLAPPWTF